ncbi:MAG: hypothetical protein LBP22_04135 [Deltaproteobacteria bacterium]|nr:hypothetical protein [Deltaproteobacteria bacterium]
MPYKIENADRLGAIASALTEDHSLDPGAGAGMAAAGVMVPFAKVVPSLRLMSAQLRSRHSLMRKHPNSGSMVTSCEQEFVCE